jgi:inositol polyphosphate 5-phosphatase INPP5B/F
MDIAITALVDHESASRLNAGSKDIKNVLILHLMNGKDQFIPMTAQFGELYLYRAHRILNAGSEYTCFANSLTRLARLPGPIRTLSSLDELLLESRSLTSPREVARLVNWLMRTKVPLVSEYPE